MTLTKETSGWVSDRAAHTASRFARGKGLPAEGEKASPQKGQSNQDKDLRIRAILLVDKGLAVRCQRLTPMRRRHCGRAQIPSKNRPNVCVQPLDSGACVHSASRDGGWAAQAASASAR